MLFYVMTVFEIILLGCEKIISNFLREHNRIRQNVKKYSTEIVFCRNDYCEGIIISKQ